MKPSSPLVPTLTINEAHTTTHTTRLCLSSGDQPFRTLQTEMQTNKKEDTCAASFLG